VNAMLTDDDLARLLGDAAATFEVPDQGPVLDKLVVRKRSVALPGKGWQLTAAAASVVVLGALLVPSLGGGTSSSSSTAVKSAPSNADNGLGANSPQTEKQGTFTITSGGSAAGLAPGSPRLPATAPGTVKAPAAAVADSAKVVKTGTITLLADKDKVSDLVVSVRGLVAGAGGYVSDSTSQELTADPSATLTMRIPVAAFDTVIGKVRGLGAKVVSVDSKGKDVTASYADTEAQIASLKAARNRFLVILSGAKSIGDTLSVQQRVDDVQGQIDRLEGQRRLLADQSSLATLTVTVGVKAPAAVQAKERGGLSRSWDRAKHGFTSGAEGIVARSGRALLVLLVLGLALVVGRVGWRLARRRLL
jgi:hypothetical protein